MNYPKSDEKLKLARPPYNGLFQVNGLPGLNNFNLYMNEHGRLTNSILGAVINNEIRYRTNSDIIPDVVIRPKSDLSLDYVPSKFLSDPFNEDIYLSAYINLPNSGLSSMLAPETIYMEDKGVSALTDRNPSSIIQQNAKINRVIRRVSVDNNPIKTLENVDMYAGFYDDKNGIEQRTPGFTTIGCYNGHHVEKENLEVLVLNRDYEYLKDTLLTLSPSLSGSPTGKSNYVYTSNMYAANRYVHAWGSLDIDFFQMPRNINKDFGESSYCYIKTGAIVRIPSQDKQIVVPDVGVFTPRFNFYFKYGTIKEMPKEMINIGPTQRAVTTLSTALAVNNGEYADTKYKTTGLGSETSMIYFNYWLGDINNYSYYFLQSWVDNIFSFNDYNSLENKFHFSLPIISTTYGYPLNAGWETYPIKKNIEIVDYWMGFKFT